VANTVHAVGVNGARAIRRGRCRLGRFNDLPGEGEEGGGGRRREERGGRSLAVPLHQSRARMRRVHAHTHTQSLLESASELVLCPFVQHTLYNMPGESRTQTYIYIVYWN